MLLLTKSIIKWMEGADMKGNIANKFYLSAGKKYFEMFGQILVSAFTAKCKRQTTTYRKTEK